MEMENKKQTKKDESSRESHHGEDVVSERERKSKSKSEKQKELKKLSMNIRPPRNNTLYGLISISKKHEA